MLKGGGFCEECEVLRKMARSTERKGDLKCEQIIIQ